MACCSWLRSAPRLMLTLTWCVVTDVPSTWTSLGLSVSAGHTNTTRESVRGPGRFPASLARIQRCHCYTTASNPFCSIRLRSFKAIPVGRFLPISHFCTVERFLLRHAAKTAWRTCARLRIVRISSGVSGCTGLRHTLSKSRMVISAKSPASWRPRAVSCTSWRIRDCAIGYLLQFSVLEGSADGFNRQCEQMLRQEFESPQFLARDIVAFVF